MDREDSLAAAPGVNARAQVLVADMLARQGALRIGVARGTHGETLIDAGSRHTGGIEAGLALARICLGGLGDVALVPGGLARWPWRVCVRSSHPVVACLGSQYAGWSLAQGDFFALGSGPGRALARKEPLFAELGYADSSEHAVLVIEGDAPPPAALAAGIAADCGVKPENLTFLYAPTRSLAGGVQVVARVLEVALHKAHALKFPLHRIIDGMGAAPLSPPHPDFMTAMGRTNDAIIYAGEVHLFVTGSANDARALAEQLPSKTSRDYGEPFAAIFKRFNGDFYKIDPLLFSPAKVIVTAVDSGESFHAGAIDAGPLEASFG